MEDKDMFSNNRLNGISLDLLNIDNFSFPDSVADFTQITALNGGTKSTYLLTHPLTKQSLVLKHGAHLDAIKIEILCNKIYQILGVPIPRSKIYKDIPHDFLKKIGIGESNGKMCQVSEYILPDNNQDQLKKIAAARKYFVIHALLGNVDLKEENFIIHKDKVYLIDAGANFVFRSLGERRFETISWVSEIKSLSDAELNHHSHQWFNTLTKKELRTQVRRLVVHKKEIEDTIWQMTLQLELSAELSDTFIQGFSDRLDYLITLFCPKEQLFAKRDKKAHPDLTAAGVFIYAVFNNETYALLGQREKHLWYGNFGGKSDLDDKYLSDTACREAREEVGFHYTRSQLFDCPFHDLITQNENGDPFIYRMYFVKHEYFDLISKPITGSEHTNYKWLKLSAIQKAVENNEIVLMEEQQTINVEVIANEVITLFPPLYYMLVSLPVKKQIERLVNRKSLLMQHTQSLVGFDQVKSMEINKYNRERNRPLHSPIHVREQISHHLLGYQNVIKELKEKNKSKHAYEEKWFVNHSSKIILSQSELHLKAILGDDYREHDITTNLRIFFKKHYDPSLVEHHQLNKLITSCAQLIEREKFFGKDYIYFYHACDSAIAFVYSIYTKLYQWLESSDHGLVFRASQENFKLFPTIQDFIAYYSDNGKKLINNYADNYNKCAFSTNLFVLGNHDVPASCSIHYWMMSERSDAELISLLENILQPFSISSDEINLLIEYYNMYLKDQGGSLYQLVIPKNEVAEIAYPAGSFGVMAEYQHSNDIVTILSELEKDIDLPHNEARKFIKNLQARVFLPPHRKITDIKQMIWLEEKYSAKNDKKLESIIQHILHTLLSQVNDTNVDKLDRSLLLFKLMSSICEYNSLRTSGVNGTLLNAILNNDAVLADILLERFPEMKWKEIAYPIHQDANNIYFSDDEIYSDTNKNWIKMTPIVLIVNYSNLSPDMILKHFGREWWINQLPPIKTLEEGIAVLYKMPVKDRMSYYHHLNQIKPELFYKPRMTIKKLAMILKSLPTDDARWVLAQYQSEISNGNRLANFLSCFLEKDRYAIALEYKDKISVRGLNGIHDIIDLLPSDKKFDFAQLCHHCINHYNFGLVMEAIPNEKRFEFAEDHLNKIPSMLQLMSIIPKLPDKERLSFLLDHKFLNYFVYDQYDAFYLVQMMPESDRFLLASYLCKKLDVKGRFYSILNYLPENERFLFVLKFIESRGRKNLVDTLTTKIDRYQLDAITYYSSKLNDKELFAIFKKLSDNDRLLFMENLKNRMSIRELLLYISEIPKQHRSNVASIYHDKILDFKDLEQVLCKLSCSERTAFANHHHDKIKNGWQLCQILPMLLEEDRLSYMLQHESLLDDGWLECAMLFIPSQYRTQLIHDLNQKRLAAGSDQFFNYFGLFSFNSSKNNNEQITRSFTFK